MLSLWKNVMYKNYIVAANVKYVYMRHIEITNRKKLTPVVFVPLKRRLSDRPMAVLAIGPSQRRPQIPTHAIMPVRMSRRRALNTELLVNVLNTQYIKRTVSKYELR